MKKISRVILLVVTLFFLKSGAVYAVDLTLTKIGALSTVGVDYSVVDYVGGVPVLEGTATPGAQVAVKIKTLTGYTSAASPSGVWVFVPASLDAGANGIVITSGTSSLAFTLNFNSIAAATPTATPTAIPTATPTLNLPETGVWENMLIALAAGAAVIYFGMYISHKMWVWEGRK